MVRPLNCLIWLLAGDVVAVVIDFVVDCLSVLLTTAYD